MKKIPILIFAITILFFSCATSGEAAKNGFRSEEPTQIPESEISDSQNEGNEISDLQNPEGEISDSQNEENEISDLQIPEDEISDSQNVEGEILDSQFSEIEIENAQIEEISESEVAETELPAEKIPQDELAELEGLLAQGEIPPSEIVIPDAATEEIAEETDVAEAEIPAQGEEDSQIEEPQLNPLDDEILAMDFPLDEEDSFQEKNSEEPPARNDFPAGNDFQDSERSDLTEANPESERSENEDENEVVEGAEKEILVPSRTMSLKRNQFVDVIYPGSGWIYLGEESGDHFTFYGRAVDNDECVFTLRSKKAGNAILHFYKNDALTGNYIDDYIAMEIDDEIALDSSHVIAPSYALAVPKRFEREKLVSDSSEAKTEVASVDGGTDSKESSGNANVLPNGSLEKKSDENAALPAKTENRPSERVQTAIQDSRIESQDDASVTSIAAPENSFGMKENETNSALQQKNGDFAQDILQRAQKAYDEKRFADALSLVKSFFEAATSDFDAGLYLQGLILEAQSEVRDIKSAIDSYDTVVKNFPQSKFWKRANERGIYLKRFYINIR